MSDAAQRSETDRAAPSADTRRLCRLLVGGQAILFALLGLARFWTFHNETFDLAFYTRIAWGLAHVEFWEPMVNAHVYGLHLSPILVPLGAIGTLTHTPTVLILAQALALAAAAVPMARVGVRHLGPAGALVGTIAWLFYPNIGHVAGYEFHPGSLAVLPLAWIALSIDRGLPRTFWLATIGVLLCREDLALTTAMAALLFGWRHPSRRRLAAIVGAVSVLYALFFFLVVHPQYAPAEGSLQLHFGRFGQSPAEVAAHLLTHPLDLLGHFAEPRRLLYLPKILAPLAFLPLLRPKWLLPALPALAVNLLSAWPTTTDLDVHYLTPALPFLVAGALDGIGRLSARWSPVAPSTIGLAIVMPVLLGHGIAGGTPLSLDFPAAAFRPDANSEIARAIVDAIPPDASVQAPYPLLAHLAERRLLHRASRPEANDDYYVLDARHRRRFAAQEDLLRTVEEPTVRDWLARDDHRLVLAGADLLLLERGGDPRAGIGARAIVGTIDPRRGRRLCACLGLLGARIEGDRLELDLVARDACPSDLAIRIGTGVRPRRVDLPFAGWLSPAHLRAGDRLQSVHRLTADERAQILARGLRVGALRQSGARPEHEDPTSILVPLRSVSPPRRR